MKKIYHKITASFAALVMLVCVAAVQGEVSAYSSKPIPKVMLTGQSFEYFEIRDGYSEISEFRNVVSSNPEVVSVKGTVPLEIEALSPGTTVISLISMFDEYEFPVTVYEEGEISLDCCSDRTMTVDEEISIEEITLSVGGVTEKISAEYFSVSSSNWDSVTYSATDGCIKINGRQPGESEVTFTMKGNEEISDTFKVTVNKKAEASKPQLLTQNVTAKKSIYATISSDEIFVGITPVKAEAEYEIYMSEKKNKGYKKVGWASSYYYRTDDSYSVKGSDRDGSKNYRGDETIAIKIKKLNKKKLKANKRYYVKIRVRYIDDNYSNEWSEFSTVKEYWTAPARIAKKSIKYSSKTGKLTVPKVKNVAGYYYGLKSFEFIGYNIFGGRVYNSQSRTSYSAKNSFVTKKIIGKKTAEEATFVHPYAKHNGYYYLDGHDPFRKLKTLESYDAHRYA